MQDPHDAQQITDYRKRRKARATQEQHDLQIIAALPEGNRFLQRLITLTGRDAASFVPNDALATAYREGQRSIGISLTSWLNDALKKTENTP